MDNNTEHTEMSSKLDKLFYFFFVISESHTPYVCWTKTYL